MIKKLLTIAILLFTITCSIGQVLEEDYYRPYKMPFQSKYNMLYVSFFVPVGLYGRQPENINNGFSSLLGEGGMGGAVGLGGGFQRFVKLSPSQNQFGFGITWGVSFDIQRWNWNQLPEEKVYQEVFEEAGINIGPQVYYHIDHNYILESYLKFGIHGGSMELGLTEGLIPYSSNWPEFSYILVNDSRFYHHTPITLGFAAKMRFFRLGLDYQSSLFTRPMVYLPGGVDDRIEFDSNFRFQHLKISLGYCF